jgi:hypothetical protein
VFVDLPGGLQGVALAGPVAQQSDDIESLASTTHPFD